MNYSNPTSNEDNLNVSPSEVVDLLEKSKLLKSSDKSHWSCAILKALDYLKVTPDVEFSDGFDLKSVMIKNGIRFRLIELEEIENDSDFGILIGSSSDGLTSFTFKNNGRNVAVNSFSDEQLIELTLTQSLYHALEKCSCVYEVYPPLPYTLTGLFDFLAFIFSQFKLELFYVALFTSISMGLQLLFPQLTVYVASTVITIGSLSYNK